MILPPVDSLDVTAGAKAILDNAPQELYIEIKVDQKVVHTTKGVARSDTAPRNEGLLLYV